MICNGWMWFMWGMGCFLMGMGAMYYWFRKEMEELDRMMEENTALRKAWVDLKKNETESAEDD